MVHQIITLLAQTSFVLMVAFVGTLLFLEFRIKDFLIITLGNIAYNFILLLFNIIIIVSEWSTKKCEIIRIFSAKEIKIIWQVNRLNLQEMNELFELPTIADRIMVKRETYDELLQVLKTDYQPIAKAQTEKIAQYLLNNFGKDYQALYYFMRLYFDYEKENPREDWSDILKMPNQLWIDGKGDCKDLAMFVSGVLSNWGVRHTLNISISRHEARLLVETFDLINDFTIIDPCCKRFNRLFFGVAPSWNINLKIL